MGIDRTNRALRCAVCVLAICTCAAAVPSAVAIVRTTPPRTASLTPWEYAEQARDRLEAIPQSARTRLDYTRTLDAFRALYHDSPRDIHAPASVFAVAELLADQGRTLHDPRSSQAAIGQYDFLITQYPTNVLIPMAILAQGQVYQDDLANPKAARERYQFLLHTHPHSEQAEPARAAIASLTAPPHKAEPIPEPPPAETPVASATPRHSGLPPMATTAQLTPARDTVPNTALPVATDLPVALPVSHAPTPTRKPHAAQVTGIRHWSTPTYTRVAIDLGDDVTYEAARVPHPDRLFFDLHGTHLSPELANKSFAVTDDGFLKKIRAAQSTPDTTRVVLDVSDVTEYSAFLLPNPYRLIIDIHGRAPQQVANDGSINDVRPPAQTESPKASPSVVPSPRVAQTQRVTLDKPVPNTLTVKSPASSIEVASLSDQPGKVDATNKPTSRPIAATVPEPEKPTEIASLITPTLPRKRTKSHIPDTITEPATPARAAVPTANGETSLVRALGLKIGRIVIDAGHGGHDSGTLGVGGIQEKDVVLDVALRLGKLLHERLGAEIIYTRSDDTFIPLETRTAIANKAQADLFLSIHANSSPDPTARGVETYYLNFTSSTDALQVAARENAVSGQSIHQLSDLVKKITLKDKIDESREFASDVEQSLYGGLATGNEGLKNRGVKKAPFVVLIGANMPSILAEISFVTNDRDAEQLRRPDYRQRVAESLYKGVARYEAGLGDPHTPLERVASN